MNIFSILSFFAFAIYLYIGFYAYRLEKHSMINRLFMFFCISMAIWSFAYAFVYVTREEETIWMEISAVGWCTFSSFILHLVLLFTENSLIKKTCVKAAIYFPSVLFFCMSVFLFWKDSRPSKPVEDFFYIGDFIYNFSFLLTSMCLIAIWGMKSHSIRKKKQSRIIVITSLIPFLMDILTQNILPLAGIELVPLIGHIYSLIMIMGIYYAMIKYRLFAITPKLLVEELLQEMMDLVILVSPEGRITRINNCTEKLLGYSNEELFDRPLTGVIQQEAVSRILNTSQSTAIHRFSEVYCLKKDGTKVPVSMSCSLIIDPVIKDVLGMAIVGQDISVIKRLELEIQEHRKAEEHILYLAHHDSLTGLPNRKYFYKILNQTLEDANKTGGKFAVMFADLDNLKVVNDNLGHEAGDQLLCEVGRRAGECISKKDIVARIGGDEFTFLIFGLDKPEDAYNTAENMLKSINRPITIFGQVFDVSLSIGVSVYPYDGMDADVLVKKADNEMYIAKKEKKQLLQF